MSNTLTGRVPLPQDIIFIFGMIFWVRNQKEVDKIYSR